MAPISSKTHITKVSTGKPAPKRPRKEPASKQVFKSAEYVAESDLEDDEEDEIKAAPVSLKKSPILPPSVKAKVNGKNDMKKASSPSSEEEEDESEAAEEVNGRIGDSEEEESEEETSEGARNVQNQENGSDEEEEEEQEDDEEADEMELDEEPPPPLVTSKAASSQKSPARSTVTSSQKAPARSSVATSQNQSAVEKPTQEKRPYTAAPIPPVPFVPPRGFQLTPVDGEPTASQLFKKSRLEGKQIWYITAPSSIPVTEIENLSLGRARIGSAAFAYVGNKFGFFEDATLDKSRIKLVLPKPSAEGYQLSSTPIDHIITIQQVHDLSIPTIAPTIIPEKEAPRPQPQGLKMRFRPIGFEEAKSPRTPVVRTATNSPPKRRVLEDNDEVVVEETPRKKKKVKSSQQGGLETPKSERRKEKHRDREKTAKKISLD